MAANYSIPRTLIDATSFGHLMLFVGAGVSKQADRSKYPNWSELVLELLKRSVLDHHIRKDEADDIRALAKSGKLLLAASAIKRRVPEGFYLQMLESLFTNAADPAPIHYTLLRLRPSLLITTNYDNLLETAFAKEYSRSMTVVLNADPVRAVRRLTSTASPARPFLLKIHGDIQQPNTLILTNSDYAGLIHGNAAYRHLITTLFISRVPLFVGFSLADPEIVDLLAHLHTALGPQNKLAFLLTSDNALSEIEKDSFLKDYSVQVLTYPYDRGHSHLNSYLQSLKRKAVI
jgi:hypothetical protein